MVVNIGISGNRITPRGGSTMAGTRISFRSTPLVLVALLGLACGGGSTTTEASTSISSITFADAPLLYVYKGTSASMTVTAKGSDGVALPSSNADVAALVWSSSDPTIATVVGTGATATVAGLKFGSTTIHAKSGSVDAAIAVTVNNGINSVTVTKALAQIAEGEVTTVTATVLGPNPDHSVIWSTRTGNVGFVDQTGLVSAIDDGTINIVATSNADNAVSGTTQITVVNAVLPSVTLTSMTQASSPAGCATAVGATVVATSVCGTVNLNLSLAAATHNTKLIEVLIGATVCASQALDTKAAQALTLACNTAGVAAGSNSFIVRVTHRTAAAPTVPVLRTLITQPITIMP
jgi:hypothetical protein